MNACWSVITDLVEELRSAEAPDTTLAGSKFGLQEIYFSKPKETIKRFKEVIFHKS